MRRRGYDVTVVDIAQSLKKGGTPVNIEKRTIDIVKRMGLFDRIRVNRIAMTTTDFKDANNITQTSMDRGQVSEAEYEIERDVLLDIMYDAVKRDVNFVFGDSVATLKDEGDHVDVSFKRGQRQSFDLVLGCDGLHSIVRRLCFGDEAQYVHFLNAYFSITIVNKLLIPEYTTQLYNEPGKLAMLNAYNGKSDVVLCFASDHELPYDYRNEAQQRALIAQHFTGSGWRIAEMLREVEGSERFYFDKLCQVKMPSWTKGRVGLVGDAAYCASPAAGKGGSLAIDGAAALGDAFEQHNDNFELAFDEYNRNFRPYIDEVQADVINFGLAMLLPRTEEAIRQRNSGNVSMDSH